MCEKDWCIPTEEAERFEAIKHTDALRRLDVVWFQENQNQLATIKQRHICVYLDSVVCIYEKLMRTTCYLDRYCA